MRHRGVHPPQLLHGGGRSPAVARISDAAAGAYAAASATLVAAAGCGGDPVFSAASPFCLAFSLGGIADGAARLVVLVLDVVLGVVPEEFYVFHVGQPTPSW